MTLQDAVSGARTWLARPGRADILKGALVGLAAGALVLPLIVSQAPSRSPGLVSPVMAMPHAARRADLGDGVTRTGEKVLHAYSKPGEYVVRLGVADSTGLPCGQTWDEIKVDMRTRGQAQEQAQR